MTQNLTEGAVDEIWLKIRRKVLSTKLEASASASAGVGVSVGAILDPTTRDKKNTRQELTGVTSV